MAWQTPVGPFLAIGVEVNADTQTVQRNVIISEQASSLRAKYGPRPPPSATGP